MRTTLWIVHCGLVLPVAAASAQVASPAKGQIQVSVDPRVELMSIIFQLAGNPEYNRAANYPYARDVQAHFAPFKDHAVVRRARQLREQRGVSYDAVMSMAFHVTDAYTLKERVPFEPRPPGLDGRWQIDEARDFLEQARQFVRESKYKSFVRRHQVLYDQSTERLQARLQKRGYLQWFEEFFGVPAAARFHAVAGLLTGPNNYGCTVHLPDGEVIYEVLGVYEVDAAGVPLFSDSIVSTVVHEFCHAFVNPIVYRNEDALRRAGKKLFADVEPAMRRQAYGNWPTMMHESVVRACTARYLLHADGPQAADQSIRADQARSFVWTRELVQLLDEYEKQRQRYANFESFFPKISAFFEDYAPKDLGSLAQAPLGPINSVFEKYLNADAMLVVMPDGDGSGRSARRFAQFVRAIHGKVFKPRGVPLVRASEVDAAARRSKVLVLYGSPTSNELLKDLLSKCAINITRAGIELPGRKFDGGDLVLITCFPNPYNADLPMIIYSSAKEENAIEINNFLYGPTDYVIGRWVAGKPTIVHQGAYRRDPDGHWSASE